MKAREESRKEIIQIEHNIHVIYPTAEVFPTCSLRAAAHRKHSANLYRPRCRNLVHYVRKFDVRQLMLAQRISVITHDQDHRSTER